MIRINDIISYSCSGPRPNQEDYVIAPSDNSSRIFVLCDGMGGHGHGEVASKTVADSVCHYLEELNAAEYSEENLQDAVDFALKELISADIYDDEKSMGTTLVVVVVNRMNVLVGHIGDSRCYQFSEDGLKKFRSKDHSKVQEAVDAEILTEEEAWSNPKKNLLTRCITSKLTSVELEIDKLRIENNDCVMLCSDGVTDALKDSQIQSIIVGRSLEDAADIIKTECEISSHDNFSLILISFSQDEVNHDETVTDPDSHNDSGINESESVTTVGKCPHCGRDLAENAKFCPACGLACSPRHTLSDADISNSGPVSAFKNWIKDINPLWVLGAGILIGGVISGVVVSCSEAPETHGVEPVSVPAIGENVIPESELNSFMAGICGIDTVNTSNDTLISKQMLSDEYQDFLNEIHEKSR